MNQNKFGKLTLTLRVELKLCQLKHAEELARTVAASYPRSEAIYRGEPVTADDVIRQWGLYSVGQAPPHPECRCLRCNPEEFLANVRQEQAKTEEFIERLHAEREGSK